MKRILFHCYIYILDDEVSLKLVARNTVLHFNVLLPTNMFLSYSNNFIHMLNKSFKEVPCCGMDSTFMKGKNPF